MHINIAPGYCLFYIQLCGALDSVGQPQAVGGEGAPATGRTTRTRAEPRFSRPMGQRSDRQKTGQIKLLQMAEISGFRQVVGLHQFYICHYPVTNYHKHATVYTILHFWDNVDDDDDDDDDD